MKRYQFRPTSDQPQPLIVQLHDYDCTCVLCEPPHPSAAPPMGFVELGRIAIAALIVAHIFAALIWGPATVWHILVANLTGQPL